jgi:hypothetical protein
LEFSGWMTDATFRIRLMLQGSFPESYYAEAGTFSLASAGFLSPKGPEPFS